MYGRPRLLPSVLGLAPAAWYRFGQGITTVGGAVSQWNDQSGNARHLLQAVAGDRPLLQTDGSILFNGINHYLRANVFTLNQPETVYFLGKQITWTNNDYFFDGGGSNTMILRQRPGGASPQLAIFAGVAAGNDTNLALDTYGVVTSIFNGASSFLGVNENAGATVNAGASNASGFTLATVAAHNGQFSNIQVKEIIIYPAAHTFNQRDTVRAYLRNL